MLDVMLSRCVCVCDISLGGEGNVRCPVLSSWEMWYLKTKTVTLMLLLLLLTVFCSFPVNITTVYSASMLVSVLLRRDV